MPEVSRAVLRKLMSQLLRTSSDLDAFILDYFPSVYRRFSAGMDRTARENLLLTLADSGEIVAALRANALPEGVQQIDAALRAEASPETGTAAIEPASKAEPPSAAASPPLLYFEYADSDEAMLDELVKHLVPFERRGQLNIFHRGRILVGRNVQHELDVMLSQASLIVPLISAGLLSRFDFDRFMQKALRRQSEGALLVPVLLRAANWEETAIGHLQPLPIDRRPLALRTRASERDAELATIATRLFHSAQSVRVAPGQVEPPSPPAMRERVAEPVRTDAAPIRAPALTPADPTDKATTTNVFKPSSPASFILHLSDLHFSSAAQVTPFLDFLEADLHELRALVPRLDGVVLSGDLTQQATPAEFAIAGRFLTELCTGFTVNPQHLVIVPGNHDGSWQLSEAAYGAGVVDQLGVPVAATPDPELYMRRFEAFAAFYKETVGSPYTLAFAEQATLHTFPEQKLLFLGLNSAWQCDHLKMHRGRASIQIEALSMALRAIRREPTYADWLKIAVFHHPVQSDGEDRIKNTGFLDRLAQAGFRLALHGHMHTAKQLQHAYDVTADGRKLRVVGAGTFGAPTTEWRAGVPLQYQILCIAGSRVTVRSRCRGNPEGPWQADGRWVVGAETRSYYEIDL